MSETGAETVIIGVGNELYGDEGVGVIVARQLAAEELPAGVRVVEGAVGGLNLLFEMEGARCVILVDAVEMGAEPGAVRAFSPDEAVIVSLEKVASLHQIGLEHVLELGKLVGVAPQVHIVGIQPQEVAPGFELSEPVARAVPLALRRVRELLVAAACR